MDINKVKALLDSMPVSESRYELKNFNLETFGSFPRQLRAALLLKESIHDEIEETSAEIDLLSLDASREQDPERKDIIERKAKAGISQLARHKKNLEYRLSAVDSWLDDQDPDQCTDASEQFEDGERDYWTERLGRLAAVEILSIGRTKPDTMEKLSQLPLADYKKAVAITAQLAEFLKQIAAQVEETLFPSQEGMPSGDNIATQQATQQANQP